MNARIRLIAGAFIIASVTLSYFHSRYWLWFTLFVGVNLFQSALTRWCLMEDILRKLGVGAACRAFRHQPTRLARPLEVRAMLRAMISLILLALFSVAAHASDGSAPPKRISLEDAITIALHDNRSLRAAAFGTEAAQAEIGVARGAMIPRLDAGENFSYTDNPVQVFSDLLLQQDFSQRDFALDQLNHPGFLSNFQSQVRLSFPLFAGGRLIAAYRAAGFAADAEHWQAIQTRQGVEFAVIQAYYTAVLAEQRVAVVDRALAAARAHLKRDTRSVRRTEWLSIPTCSEPTFSSVLSNRSGFKLKAN